MLIASSVAIRLFAPSTNGELWQLFKKQTLSQSRSVDGRLASCRNAITLFSEHPLIGVGPNNFALQYVPLAGAGSAPFVGRTYNIALSILVERGGLGFLAYGFLLFAVLRAELFHMRWDLGANRIWAALRAAGIIALLARDATNSTLLTVAPVSMLLWLLFSMAACRASDTRLAADTPLPSRFPLSLVTAATVLGLAGALLTSYYAFRYSEAYGHFLAARKFVQAAQYSSAEAALDTAIREDPDNSYYYAARGLVLARSFQPPDDVESGPCGIQPQPQPRADILARSTDDIRHALKLNPNDDGLYYSLASLRWYAGDWPGFEYNVRRAIAVDRDEPLYHIALAKIFEHHGAEDFADAEYLTAVLDRPQILSSRWYRNLEQCSPARAQKIAQRAIDEFTTRLRSQDQDSALLRAELGSVFLRVGRLRDATTELDAAVVALPQLPRAWLNLGKALNAAGRQREAKRAFEESIFLHWNDPNPHEELAPLLYSNGEFSAAADQWEIALRPLQEQEHSSRIARVYNVKAIDNGNDLIGPRSITCIQPEVDRAQAARSLAATLKILGRDDKTTQN
jgi:Tfp pilus assembly protein PilF